MSVTDPGDERVRRRARELWEADGRPQGREDEFLERARELIAMEDNADAGLLPNPMTHPSRAEDGVEEAEIQENYGEFPERMTDQGDRRHTPDPDAPHSHNE
ncbi:MAG TPA: DUF2934 domain-containing protein [Acetobacteraceae bacterium]|nr:DUF2934 domain-containing protein [Acetobacteraceae bacterium]